MTAEKALIVDYKRRHLLPIRGIVSLTCIGPQAPGAVVSTWHKAEKISFDAATSELMSSNEAYALIVAGRRGRMRILAKLSFNVSRSPSGSTPKFEIYLRARLWCQSQLQAQTNDGLIVGVCR